MTIFEQQCSINGPISLCQRQLDSYGHH